MLAPETKSEAKSAIEEDLAKKIEEEKTHDSDVPSEKGQPDSDDDEDSRISNMLDPEKKRFNVNDILGDFDRDEKGNPLILQDPKGALIDKTGNRVN